MAKVPVSDIARSQETANRGVSAYRSGYASLELDEEMIGYSQEESKAQEERELEELSVIKSIADLMSMPGYQTMRNARLETIAHYRSGAFAKSLLADGSITDEEFGKKMRVGLLVADELEHELLTVEQAVEAVKQEKSKPHARTRQKRD